MIYYDSFGTRFPIVYYPPLRFYDYPHLDCSVYHRLIVDFDVSKILSLSSRDPLNFHPLLGI